MTASGMILKSGIRLRPGINICQSDLPLDWYQAELQPYAEEYLALPDRTPETVLPWLDSYIRPALAHFGEALLLAAHYYATMTRSSPYRSWSCAAIGATIGSLAIISMVHPALALVIQTDWSSPARIAIDSAMKCTADSTTTFFSGCFTEPHHTPETISTDTSTDGGGDLTTDELVEEALLRDGYGRVLSLLWVP